MCQMCIDPNYGQSLQKQIIHQKYTHVFTFFFSKPVNEILRNKNLHHVQMFKEFLFYDDEEEYLQGWGSLSHIKAKLQRDDHIQPFLRDINTFNKLKPGFKCKRKNTLIHMDNAQRKRSTEIILQQETLKQGSFMEDVERHINMQDISYETICHDIYDPEHSSDSVKSRNMLEISPSRKTQKRIKKLIFQHHPSKGLILNFPNMSWIMCRKYVKQIHPLIHHQNDHLIHLEAPIIARILRTRMMYILVNICIKIFLKQQSHLKRQFLKQLNSTSKPKAKSNLWDKNINDAPIFDYKIIQEFLKYTNFRKCTHQKQISIFVLALESKSISKTNLSLHSNIQGSKNIIPVNQFYHQLIKEQQDELNDIDQRGNVKTELHQNLNHSQSHLKNSTQPVYSCNSEKQKCAKTILLFDKLQMCFNAKNMKQQAQQIQMNQGQRQSLQSLLQKFQKYISVSPLNQTPQSRSPNALIKRSTLNNFNSPASYCSPSKKLINQKAQENSFLDTLLTKLRQSDNGKSKPQEKNPYIK